MRVGIVRTDLGSGVYLADIESRVQRCFSSEPPGQSRNIRRPTDAEMDGLLATYPLPVETTGSDTNAAVDTSVNDTLRIRTAPGAAYTVIAVTAGAATAKTTIRDDLNAAFVANGLPVEARIVGTNQIQLVTTGDNTGSSAYLDIDTIANGSTLNTPLGLTDGDTQTGQSLATLRAAIQAVVYPTPTTIDVSIGTIGAVATIGDLGAPYQLALINGIQDLVAPRLVETGLVLLSFAQGKLSELIDPTFQPGGARAGHPAGVAAAVVEDDGSTVFTYP